LPARSNSSARPENRTAFGPGASQRSRVTHPDQTSSPITTLLEPPAVVRPFRLDLVQRDAFAHRPPQMCVSCARRSGIARNTPLRSVVCGPCWFASGGETDAAELTGRPAVAESVLPRTAHDWAHAVFASRWFVARRRDCAARLRLLVRTLALHADWDDHSSFPTWDRLMEATGWSRSTMSSWLAELHRLGWLARLERGTTPQFRPMALQHVEGNRAAVYQLRVPVTAEDSASTALTRTPTLSRNPVSNREHVVPTRARKIIHSSHTKPQVNHTIAGPTGPRLDGKSAGFFDLRVPVSAGQMLAAAAELKHADRALWRVSPRALRAIVRPWWRAGWTNSDVLHALDHAPATGGPRRSDRCPAAELRRPEGWIKHRLRRWQVAGTPVAAPRVWEPLRTEVVERHGAAAARRLTYGAGELTATDVELTAAERTAAAAAVTEQLTRRWAREFHERRNAPRPEQDIANPDHRRSVITSWRRTSSTPEKPAPPPSALEAPAYDSPANTASPEASAYERALERARAEGRLARPRLPRRRHRR
jgi:hypothetical protein